MRVRCLGEDGWVVTKPEGSFYMLVEAPGTEDDLLDALFEEGGLALGGSVMNIPGWIRLHP
jgi:aspartate/methionine/tyrosine aminotransferase